MRPAEKAATLERGEADTRSGKDEALVEARDCGRRGPERDGAEELRVGVVADPALPAEVAAHGLAEHLAAKIGPWPRWLVEASIAVKATPARPGGRPCSGSSAI